VASPFSGVVLGASAALASPTLYAAFIVGSVPIEDALLRFVVTIVLTTVAVTLVEWLFLGTSPMTESQQEAARRLSDLAAKGKAAGDLTGPGTGVATGEGAGD
jgi:hypothetical protein